jgi:DNA replication protein DnaC
MMAMDRLQEILAKFGSDTTFDMSPRDYEQFKVDDWNKTAGSRNEEDGYNCNICKNKGTIAKLVDNGNGTYSHCFADCRCVETRNSIMRMKRSGLKDIIKDYTFDKFIDSEPWQKSIKSAAMEYAHNPEGWFFIGGQSGSGKTHLCTAICREFLLSGRKVMYMLWRDEVVRIKAAVNDSIEYGKLIDKYKTVDVLYIDDLFKTGKAPDGSSLKVTGGDVNVAFEILNYRYNNPSLLTIISSELSEDDLVDIDEAVGGRIYERAKAITIGKDRSRNYRIRKAVTL